MTPKLRIFIGTSARGEDAEACAVLEHSLRRRASIPLSVELLHVCDNAASPTGGWDTSRWTTPWTALRWAIPEICGFTGRAIYFDCPTLVLDDIAILAHAPLTSGAIALMRRSGRTLSTACIVFDCARAGRMLPRIADMRADVGAHQTVGHLFERRPSLVGPLPCGWGASDAEAAARTFPYHFESVHFESPYTQPHIPRARARLARAGKRHWFTGITLPHYCSTLTGMFDAEYAMMEAQAAE